MLKLKRDCAIASIILIVYNSSINNKLMCKILDLILYVFAISFAILLVPFRITHNRVLLLNEYTVWKE